jgi:hypothetical protein
VTAFGLDRRQGSVEAAEDLTASRIAARLAEHKAAASEAEQEAQEKERVREQVSEFNVMSHMLFGPCIHA